VIGEVVGESELVVLVLTRGCKLASFTIYINNSNNNHHDNNNWSTNFDKRPHHRLVALQWAGHPQKLPLFVGNLEPSLIHGNLGPHESAV